MLGLADEPLQICALSDVGGNEDGVASRLADRARQRLPLRGADVGDDDLGAFVGIETGGGLADAGRGAGHYRGLSGEAAAPRRRIHRVPRSGPSRTGSRLRPWNTAWGCHSRTAGSAASSISGNPPAKCSKIIRPSSLAREAPRQT